MRISKLNESDLLETQRLIYKNISFIDEGQIPKTFRLKAYNLVKDVDLNDIAFVVLKEFQNSVLWTGDKVLINGLKANGYERVISTQEMVRLRNKLENIE